MNIFIYIYLFFAALGILQLIFQNNNLGALRSTISTLLIIVPFLYLPAYWAVGVALINNIIVLLDESQEDGVRVAGSIIAFVALLLLFSNIPS